MHFNLQIVISAKIFYRIFSSLNMLLLWVSWTYSKKKKGCHGPGTWCISMISRGDLQFFLMISIHFLYKIGKSGYCLVTRKLGPWPPNFFSLIPFRLVKGTYLQNMKKIYWKIKIMVCAVEMRTARVWLDLKCENSWHFSASFHNLRSDSLTDTPCTFLALIVQKLLTHFRAPLIFAH